MTISIEDMAVFCKKKGFVYQNSEIYGSMAGFWDFGPLGVGLKNNIKQHWWKTFVQNREDMVGIDGSIITHPRVWEASGHTSSFADIILTCTKCRNKVRADHFLEDQTKISTEGKKTAEINKIVKEQGLKCPKCKASFEEGKDFNLMFETYVGPLKDAASLSYLRPETAQLIFTNFKQVFETSRLKLPFGIAQIGKAFRNEISPRDFLFRSREFEQMEIEFFTHPDKINECPFFNGIKNLKAAVLLANNKEARMSFDEIAKKLTSKWHAYWLALSYRWFLDLGISNKNLRLREHRKDELAHYAKACFDVEYNFPFGWKEIHGNADRTTFDLKQHARFSNKELGIYDEETKEKCVPYVASEPSQGIERAFLAFMFDAYNDDKKRGNIVLKLHPILAPVKIGIFPLVNKLDRHAREIFEGLKMEFASVFDRSGSIGRRYARADEIGIPYCVTFDFDSVKDKAVTIRERDTTKQVRVPIKELKEIIRKLLNFEGAFEKAGKLFKG